jgi:polysaccharide biosynthesis protein PslF
MHPVPFSRENRSPLNKSRLNDSPLTFGMLSTFPPTECGIATFAAALAAGIITGGGVVDVVRCGPAPSLEDASVLAEIGGGAPCHVPAAVDVLNRTDVAIVQHEYGIYAGPDGVAVLDIVDRVVVPTIVVAHTVLEQPSRGQRMVLERLCNRADAVVVMTEVARRRLIDDFRIEPFKVSVIHHGAATPSASEQTETRPSDREPRLLTWGLLGPGKGIEWAIDALSQLEDLRPLPQYIVAGATHPKVVQRSGEAYREMLIKRAAASRVSAQVSFDDTYRDLPSLNSLIRSADLVVLPYDSKDQVTSGVLVDAVAAGRPVISTAFPHAVELLASGAGIVVPQRDPAALARAIRSVLTNPARRESMATEARRLAPELSWTAVASQYEALGSRLLASSAPMML